MRFATLPVLFSAVILFSAMASANCLNKISTLRGWQPATESLTTCLAANEEYNDGTSVVCSEDKSDISEAYKKYLAYEQTYKTAFAAYKTAQDSATKSAAAFEMKYAKEDLNNYGLQSGVLFALNKVSSARFACSQ